MNKKKFTTGRMKKLPKVQRKKKGYVRRHCTELFLKGEAKIGGGKAVTSLVRMDRLLSEFLWWFWF